MKRKCMSSLALSIPVLFLISACSGEPTDNASACRDFEQAFTATAAGRMPSDEYGRHLMADKKATTGRLGQVFRLDYIYPSLIAQECRRVGVAIDLSKK